MPTDFNTANKSCIRNNYNKVLIKHLKEKYGYDIVYFGLPSPDAHDVECWLEYISYVVAFQCRDYKQVSSPELPTDEIDKLIYKLNEWEAAAKIKGYNVYDGFMEEVIFNGYDNSASGAVQFSFDKVVTLFNLDFCNKITSPQEYLNSDGDYVKKYKFELIDKILALQNKITTNEQRFILFLTINGGYDGAELSEYITASNSELQRYNTCNKSSKKQFILKHFVESVLYDKIKKSDFIPYFLPTIFYNGVSDVKMMQVAVLCIKPNTESKSAAGTFVYYQSEQEVLSHNPITPNNKNDSFILYDCKIEGMKDNDVDFMTKFCSSNTYAKYWKSKDK